jgi:hypothetical protein
MNQFCLRFITPHSNHAIAVHGGDAPAASAIRFDHT